MTALNSATKNTALAGSSMEKLSSGLKINKAADNATGLAISEKMRSQIRGLDQASQNTQDGISVVQTAEGAIEEVGNIVQRMRELAVQGANETNTGSDRAKISEELTQLHEEIDRIAESTQFNGKDLLNGTNTVRVENGHDVKHDNTGVNTSVNIEVQDGFDFDDVVQIMPSPVSHNLWNRILSLTLENYSTLLAPETVVFCEGTTRGRKRKDFDAKCYANIFSTTHPSTVFYSLGGCNDIEEDKLKVIGLTQAIVPNTNVIRIIDRDDRSENEVEELSEKGIKVLDRRHLESYLLDDEIIKKWCATVGKAELENSALTIKQQAINASISRGNATDDIKSASNDIVTNIKKLLGLTACGNNGEAIIRDTITPLITPDTQVSTTRTADFWLMLMVPKWCPHSF